MRLTLFAAFLVIGVLAIGGRYASLMAFTERRPTDPVVQLPRVDRGPILDRNGRILAMTTELDSVTAWVPAVDDPALTASLLAEILDLKPSQVTARMARGTDFVFIERKVTPTQSAAIRQAQQEGYLEGITLQPEQARSYPEQDLAAHVLGFVGVDNIGLEGIENTFNHVLAPDTIGGGVEEVYGNQVFLTLDINVQYVMEQLAAAARSEHEADRVFVLVAAAKTGELLAYASRPSFDPNDYNATPAEHRRNAIATMAYEPGSVFKVFSMAALLQGGAITRDSVFPSPGYYEQPLPDGSTIRIEDLGAYGQIDVQRVLQYSSNAGAAYASDRIDAERFDALLRELGFGATTGSPYLGENSGILREVAQWSARSKPTIAIGQEISVTALQVIQAATAIANDGVLLRPQIVHRVTAADGSVIKAFEPEPLRAVLAPTVARGVREMMETATGAGGTARRARLDGYRLSAKTGTAQVIDPETGGYSEQRVTASVLGMLPTDDPQLIVYIVLHNPRGAQRFGGVIATPLLKQALEFLTTYYLLPRDGEQPAVHDGRVVPPAVATLDGELAGTMPDLAGLPARRLLPLFTASGLRLELIGSGHVYAQRPGPGAPLEPGATVQVWLR